MIASDGREPSESSDDVERCFLDKTKYILDGQSIGDAQTSLDVSRQGQGQYDPCIDLSGHWTPALGRYPASDQQPGGPPDFLAPKSSNPGPALGLSYPMADIHASILSPNPFQADAPQMRPSGSLQNSVSGGVFDGFAENFPNSASNLTNQLVSNPFARPNPQFFTPEGFTRSKTAFSFTDKPTAGKRFHANLRDTPNFTLDTSPDVFSPLSNNLVGMRSIVHSSSVPIHDSTTYMGHSVPGVPPGLETVAETREMLPFTGISQPSAPDTFSGVYTPTIARVSPLRGPFDPLVTGPSGARSIGSMHAHSDVSNLIDLIPKLSGSSTHASSILKQLCDMLEAPDIGFYIGRILSVTVGCFTNICDTENGYRFLIALANKCKMLDQMSNLYNIIEDNTLLMASQQFGCRLLQHMIGFMDAPALLRCCAIMRPRYLSLCYHATGNHVMQRIIEMLGHCSLYTEGCYNELLDLAAVLLQHPEDFKTLCMQTRGCRIYQKLFPHLRDDRLLESLDSIIASNFVLYCSDQWANFCIQAVIENSAFSRLRPLVVQCLLNNAYALCAQKFGSHVVEDFLDHSSIEERAALYSTILSLSKFGELMRDPYGNFIVQKMLRKSAAHTAKEDLLRKICARVCISFVNKHIFSVAELVHIRRYLTKYVNKLEALKELSPQEVTSTLHELLLLPGDRAGGLNSCGKTVNE